MATAFIVGGVYLSIKKWDRMWLVVSASGLILMFIGSFLYCCGTRALNQDDIHYDEDDDFEEIQQRRRRKKMKRSYQKRRYNSDKLMPSAPPNFETRSISQLSLNMIPQYFAAMEAASTTTATAAPFSQIFNVNGQNFIILPIGDANNSVEANSKSMNNLVVKIPSMLNETQSR